MHVVRPTEVTPRHCSARWETSGRGLVLGPLLLLEARSPADPRGANSHRPRSAVTGCWALPRLGLLSAGVPVGGLAAVPQGTSTDVTSLPSLFLLHAVPKTGKKEKKKPYFVLLAIDCKEPLKHFKENIQKQGWRMSDLSIESWVHYVTAGNPLPLCKSWSPKCMKIFDVFS